jgi:hypothetical protein
MGRLGRFIDYCCDHHPRLMRAVLDRPLSPLSLWIRWDEETGARCGCLIGTMALAAGIEEVIAQRGYFLDGEELAYNEPGLQEPVMVDVGGFVTTYLAQATAMLPSDMEDIGQRVVRVAYFLWRRRVGAESPEYLRGNVPWWWRTGLHGGDAADDAMVVHLMRQRIARQLAIRESADLVSTPQLEQMAYAAG